MAAVNGQDTQRAITWKENLIESLWVSGVTKWVLTFGGKVARLALIICTLYMSAELYPGLSLPPALNVAVFILLNAALDFGGLGLAQIAKKARAAGKTEEAQAGEKLANALITVMIVGLAAVTLENAGNLIKWSPDFKTYIAVFWAVVGVGLSIYRVILAVRYGHVLHALEIALEEQKEQEHTELENLQSEVARLHADLRTEKQASDEAQSRLQSALDAAKKEKDGLIAELSKVRSSLQSELSRSTDQQSTLATMKASMQADFELSLSRVKAQLKAESLADQARLQDEIRALKAANAALKTQQKESKSAPAKAAQKGTKSTFDARAFTYECLDQDESLTLAAIVEKAKREHHQDLSEPTLSRYRRDWRSARESSDESSAM